MDSHDCSKPCAHVGADPQPLGYPLEYPLEYPFDVEYVIDAYMGITDAIVRCRGCDRLYLLGLVDWTGAKIEQRLFRMSNVDPTAYDRFAHDMSRDYCDLDRKAAELHSLSTSCTPTEQLLILDIHANAVIEVRPAPTDVPTASWRTRLNGEQVGVWIQRSDC